MFSYRRARITYRSHEIAPDEVFLDSSNLPDFDEAQFEGRMERPVSGRALVIVACVFVLISALYLGRAFQLQIVDGAEYAEKSRQNSLDRVVRFATRGVITDRNGTELAWNEPFGATTTPFAKREYITLPGFAHMLGYVRYPKADESGNWWREEYAGVSGVELSFEHLLAGTNGEELVEKTARGEFVRGNIVTPPRNGEDVHLTIDADVQTELYRVLSAHARSAGFQGGAAAVMDVRTGEIVALVSFPEYDNQGFTDGNTAVIKQAAADSRTPLLNRAVSGLYTPGSIVKPIFATAALHEGIISPEKQINSTGYISIPNPYDPEHPTIFRDWKAHGWVDMRTAIAVSSDEYFYTIGGGFGGQEGLGIRRIDEYAKLFGLGTTTGIVLSGEQSGTIPTPEWKERIFGADDPWRIGNTYHTAIGQYGFQITPLQAVRFTAAIANDGYLLTPHILASSTPASERIPISHAHFQIVRDGMRMAVTSSRPDATARALSMSDIHISGKTGTAQLGSKNQWMNSWVVGFWPAEEPKYAFAAVLEHAPAGTLSGAAPGIRPFFEWLAIHKPEYVGSRQDVL